MRQQFITSLAIIGLLATSASAAWPAFGGSPSGSSQATATGESSSSWWASSSKEDSQAAPATIPVYQPPGTQPESTTQKVSRAMNPLNWFPSTEKKPALPKDTISLDTPTGPISPQLRVSMAQLAESQGKIDEARNQMEQALVQSPNDPMVLREFARLEDRAGRFAEAEKLYGQAMALNPKDAAARNDLGLCLARAGKLKESAHVLRTAVELKPDKPLYRNNLATVLVELGDIQGAFAQLSAVHQPAVAHFNLGQLFAQRGRHEEAAGCFQNALQVDPTMQPAQAALARIYQPTAVQVAARPTAQPTPVLAEASPVIPDSTDSQPIGPAFPVPRNLPSVE